MSMNIKIGLAVLIIVGWIGIGPIRAEDIAAGTTTFSVSTPTTNATTIAASTVLMPGRYTVTIAPSFNGGMAGRLEKAVGNIGGVKSVTAEATDSSIHFTVKRGANVTISDIQKAVANAFPGAVMTTPILEHSLTANPGL